MHEEPYQNREIREMFKDVKEALVRIEDQTKQHNHRMTKIERRQVYVQGFVAAIAVGLFSVVPIILSVANYVK